MIYVLSGGVSKCSIIVHIDSGSAVAAYSNAAATTKVKDAKEIGTSGDYLITGLPTGTYYVKATKGSDKVISSAITFSAIGVVNLPMAYAIPLFGLAYQSWTTINNNMTKIGIEGTYRQFNNTDPTLQLLSISGNQGVPSIIWKTAIPTGKRYLNLRYTGTVSGNILGLSSSSTNINRLASVSVPASAAETVVSLPIDSVTGTAYAYISGCLGASDLRIKEVYVS